MDLRSVWRSRLEVLLANLCAGEQEHREIGSLAEQIGADYHGRVLIELLQNASDAAMDASLERASVTIIRTPRLVAVMNQGLPFSEKGVRSITSLGISPKDPRFSIGNKGVGFKAVYQVTDSPEIFSAHRPGGTFTDEAALRLRLDLHPFEQPGMSTQLNAILSDILREKPDVFAVLKERHGDDPAPFVVEEARHAAPFKFPIQVAKEELDGHLEALGDFGGETFQSLIALPLLEASGTQEIVNGAIQELISRGGAGILFLPGIGQISIHDRVQGRSIVVSRSQPGYLDEPTDREWAFFVKTSAVSSSASGHGDSRNEKISWIVLRRRIGGTEKEASESAEVAKDRDRILGAARLLPGESWKKVDAATVSVALPLPDPSKTGWSLPLQRGLVCIGLPTNDPTGTPLWIDARFHGTISRKGIDLSLEYNRVLFREAVVLAQEVVERLKAHPDPPFRRAVTLAMDVDSGPLAREFGVPGGLLHSEIVLKPDGTSFTRASVLALMRQDDARIVEEAQAAGVKIEQYGFRLAEASLLRNCRPLLDRLVQLAGGKVAPDGADPRFLQRGSEGQSLIEVLSSRYRNAGESFWEPFLEWLVSRFSIEDLRDQRILPVGDTDLARPSDHVFYRPAVRGGEASGAEDEEIDAIPDQVRRLLRFLDERQVRVRDVDGRRLTALARRLSPDSGMGLVESPRRESLLNEALIPRLREVVSPPGDDAVAISLLELAAKWTDVKDSRKGPRIRFEELLVPTLSEGKWIWRQPEEVYMGSGWQVDRDGELMDAAYGGVPSRRLVPWRDFTAKGGYGDDRLEWWRDGMVRFGVLPAPKVLRVRPPQPPLEALQNQKMGLVKSILCPLGQAADFWLSYLNETSFRLAHSKKGRRYTIKEVLWIDGLERNESRTAIVELVLRHPETFEPSSGTRVERADDGADWSDAPSLWVHALRTGSWQVIPTDGGLADPSKSWWLTPEQRGRDRYKPLKAVPDGYERALPILRKIGIGEIHDAPPERLISTLQDLAESLDSFGREGRRNVRTLVEEFYSKLQRQASDGVSSDRFAGILDRPIPLLKGQELTPVKLDTIDRLYIDDDPVRAQRVDGFDTALTLPLRSRTAFVALLEAFQSIVGADRLVRTSQAPVELGFVQTGESVGLLDFLKARFPAVPIESDLGVLLAFGVAGRQDLSPGGEDFRTTWTKFSKSELAFGEFPPTFDGESFYDSLRPGSPVLQVRKSLTPSGILKESWAIVGLAHRDVWSAYSHALELNRSRFFHERQIGVSERDEVDAVVFRELERAARILRPVIFALWKRGHALKDGDFRTFLEQHKSSLEDLLLQFGLPRDLSTNVVRTATSDEALVPVLPELGITFEEYQAARTELGMGPYQFEESKRLFEQGRGLLTASLAVLSLHSVSVDLETAREAIERLRATPVPEGILSHPPEGASVLRAIVEAAWNCLSPEPGARDMEILVTRIESLRRSPPAALEGLVLEGSPKREVEIYLYDSEAQRAQAAELVFDGYLKVASLLATHLVEAVDEGLFRSDPRLKEVVSGWLANRYGLLAVMRELMGKHAPKTMEALSNARAFHEIVPWRELWSRFAVLGSPPESTPAPTESQSAVLGLTDTRTALEHQLAKGSGGKIGEKILGFLADSLDFTAFRNGPRMAVRLPEKGAPRTDGKRTRSPPIPKESRALRELHGAIGEAFVFEQLRKLLPNFDETCWVSENRVRYGLEGGGNDDLGYDFEYRDTEGKLSGKSESSHCLLEVKATTGDCSTPFPISSNEWELANQCHKGEQESLYVVIRVERVAERPRVCDVLFDPVGLMEKGVLAVDAQDLWIYVGGADQNPHE